MDSNLEYVMMCSQIAKLRTSLRIISDMSWEFPASYRRVALEGIKHSREVEEHYRALDTAQERQRWMEETVLLSKYADGTLPRPKRKRKKKK